MKRIDNLSTGFPSIVKSDDTSKKKKTDFVFRIKKKILVMWLNTGSNPRLTDSLTVSQKDLEFGLVFKRVRRDTEDRHSFACDFNIRIVQNTEYMVFNPKNCKINHN